MVVFTTQKSFVIVRENLARESSKLKEISASKVIRDPYSIVLHLVLVRQPKFRLLYIPLFKVYVHGLVMNHIHALYYNTNYKNLLSTISLHCNPECGDFNRDHNYVAYSKNLHLTFCEKPFDHCKLSCLSSVKALKLI